MFAIKVLDSQRSTCVNAQITRKPNEITLRRGDMQLRS